MSASIVFRRALVYGVVISVAVAAIGALAFGLAIGQNGVVSAALAGLIGVLLAGITAGSLLFGARLVQDDPGNPLYFAVILGSWIVKFAVFLGAILLLRDQPFIDTIALFVCLVAAVVGGVIGDVVAVLRSRVPYIEPRTSGTRPDVP